MSPALPFNFLSFKKSTKNLTFLIIKWVVFFFFFTGLHVVQNADPSVSILTASWQIFFQMLLADPPFLSVRGKGRRRESIEAGN